MAGWLLDYAEIADRVWCNTARLPERLLAFTAMAIALKDIPIYEAGVKRTFNKSKKKCNNDCKWMPAERRRYARPTVRWRIRKDPKGLPFPAKRNTFPRTFSMTLLQTAGALKTPMRRISES
jgi:hypothetical protein